MAIALDERWGVAANVKAPGTKHFVAGAKVYVQWGLWGDGGERMYVWGRHRGGGRYIKLIMPAKSLENFRPVFWHGHGVETADLDWQCYPTKLGAQSEADRMETAARNWERYPGTGAAPR